MRNTTGFWWRHRAGLLTFVIGVAAASVAFLYALSLDEGTKRNVRKRLSEIRRMPGRLLT